MATAALAHTLASLRTTAANLCLAPLHRAYSLVLPPLDPLVDSINDNANHHNPTPPPPLDNHTSDTQSDWHPLDDSPWSFVSSRYALALVIVALITNRIHHICRPSATAAQRLNPKTRLALRLPAILLLARALVILTVITASLFFAPSATPNALVRHLSTRHWRQPWLALEPIGGWAHDHFGDATHHALVRARDAAALWAAFTATCVAVVTEALVRTIEADRQEAPSFNLVGFAFLLHFHSFSPDYDATEHVYLCVLLQVAEVLAVSVTKCRKRPLAPRLLVTSFFGIASTLHYLLTLRDGTYPFMQAFGRAPEIALMVVVALTVSLHALTMLVTGERIEVGRLLFNRSNMPSLDDDWSLALFKLGTACLESTRLTGLSHEVAPLHAYEGPFVEMRRNGHVRIVDAEHSGDGAGRTNDPAAAQHDGRDAERSGLYVAGGFGREIKQVRVEDSATTRPSGFASSARLREARRFAIQLYRTLCALALVCATRACSAVGLPPPRVPAWVYRALRGLRLLWHGRNGEERRERRIAEQRRQRLSDESRRAYLAWVSRAGGEAATAAGGGGSGSSSSGGVAPARGSMASRMRPRPPRRIASSDTLTESRRTPLSPPPRTATSVDAGWSARAPTAAAARSRGASPSPSSSLLDAMLWQRFLAPDAPILEEDEDESDEEWRFDDAGEDEVSSDDDEEGERRGGKEEDVAMQLKRRAEMLRYAAEEEEVEEEGEEEEPRLEEADLRLLTAHMEYDGTRPLTRSSYRSLVSASSPSHSPSAAPSSSTTAGPTRMTEQDARLLATIAARRSELEDHRAASGLDVDAERRRLCVVCCVEERNVILWPCRCLSLCMECREHLASRPPTRGVGGGAAAAAGGGGAAAGTGAGTGGVGVHLCPTCRTPVEAFSRLFVP